MSSRIWFVSCALIALGLVACGREQDVEIEGLIDIGTHSLYARCSGQGDPVVVIDTGAGDTSAGWHAIQEQAASFTRVCTYDRAGYGASEPGPRPRDSQRAADELRQLLENAGLPGPYVLAGHSLGGANAQVFAHRYPDQVAGMVLLDPPPRAFTTGQAFPELYKMAREQTTAYQQMAEAARQSADDGERGMASYLQALASEHGMLFGEGAAQVAGIASFGDIPLIVIGSDRPNPAFGEQAEPFQRFWIEQSRELAGLSTNGTFVLAQGSGHHIHQDAPERVVEAIRQVVELARR